MARERLEKLRLYLANSNIDVFFTTNLPDVRWLTGWRGVFDESPDHLAFITQDDAYIHTDSRYANAFETAAKANNSEWVVDGRKMSHVDFISEKLAVCGSARVGIDTGSMSLSVFIALSKTLKELDGAFEIVYTDGEIKKLRAVKDASEIAALRKAQELTDAGFAYMCEFMRPGLKEFEVALELEHYMRSQGSDGVSFDTIAATGANSANPHAVPGETIIQKGDFLVLDFGAKWDGYHADMTRTVCFGTPSDTQREIYEVVKQAHEAAATSIAPGKTEGEIYAVAGDIIAGAGYGDYFGHGLGHGVGLEIHEYPNLKPTCTDVLQAGSLVTVEPGIYLTGIAGCRLEDFGLVNEETGFEPFTRATHELICL